jgi:hypothetical protein
METLLYVLGFVIGALGTSFLLYFLKTRKLLRTQHKLILDLGLALVGREITEGMKKERDDKRSCEKKPTEQNDKPTHCEEKNEAK